MSAPSFKRFSDYPALAAPKASALLLIAQEGASYSVPASALMSSGVPAAAYGTLTVGSSGAAATNTATIQAAIDAARAAYQAGMGIVEVLLPAGTIWLGASTLSEIYWNDGVQVLAVNGCLAMRDGVALCGQGIGRTILKPLSPSLDTLYLINGSSQTVQDLEIDGGSATSTEVGHGILQLLSANDATTLVESLRIENVYVHHVGSYGLGLQNGRIHNSIVSGFRTYRTGADGIDVKNRGTPEDDKGLFFENIYVDTFGLRLDDQAGVDMRGIINARGIQVFNVGRAGVTQTAIRFRARDPATTDPWARRSNLHGFYAKAADPANTGAHGVWIGCPDVTVSGGVLEDCYRGVRIVGDAIGDEAVRVTVQGVNALNAGQFGFWVDDTYSQTAHVRLIGCQAFNCATAFFNEGDQTVIVGCDAYTSSVADITTKAGSDATEVLAGNSFQTSFLSLLTSASGAPSLEARGAATNIDLQLKVKGNGHFVLNPAGTGTVTIEARGSSGNIDVRLQTKGSGVVQFGTHAAKGAEAFTGFITIKDDGGTTRKVMVCS